MAREARRGEAPTDDVPRCERHGARTRLTCVDCGAPICPRCMTRTEVGLKCEVHAAPAAPAPPARSRRPLVVAAAATAAGIVAVTAALVASGALRDPEPAARRPGLPVGTWTPAPALEAIRGSTVAVPLDDGRVLVVGGGVGSVPVAATEIYEPDRGRWARSGDLVAARRGHQAVVLQDGRVLVAGGIAQGRLLETAEIWDPGTGAWTEVASMTEARLGHTMTVLRDGSVLVTGGTVAGGEPGEGSQSVRPAPSAEVFDPEANEWTRAGSMLAARFEHTATLLPDGRVLVAGGQGLQGSEVPSLASAELYDPSTGTFVRTGSLGQARANAAAVLLRDGRVLVAAGDGGTAALSSVEIFHPTRGAWSTAPSLAKARRGHTAVLLPDGSVVVAGGESFTRGSRSSLTSAERYRPGAAAWANAGEMACPRSEQAAAVLPDGTALQIAGDAAFPGEPPIAQTCVDRYLPETDGGGDAPADVVD